MSVDFVGSVVHYELTPPAEMTQEDFVRFVKEEVFPAVHGVLTRGGEKRPSQSLLTSEGAEKYLWVISSFLFASWESETEEARQKLEASGTRISAPSLYSYLAWSEDQETGP
jgi:hypothetical protein